MNQDTNVQGPSLLAPGRVALSVAEAAIAVGLSQRTLWTHIRAGNIRAARVGSRVLLLKGDLEAWLSGLADNSGTRVRGDLAEPLAARNRARAKPKEGKAETRLHSSEFMEKKREQEYRRGYWDGFDEGSENVLSGHATREEIDSLYNKIMAWAQGDCKQIIDPPKYKKGVK